jgi:hypothetical protein
MMDTLRQEWLVDELVRRADKSAHISRLRRKIEPTDNKQLIAPTTRSARRI